MRHSAFWILAALMLLAVTPTALFGQAAKHDRVADGYAKIAAKYGIEISLGEPVFPADGTMTGKKPSAKNLEIYLAMFAPEWNFYPVELVMRSKLRRIVLSEEYRVHGIVRGGAVSAAGDELFLDVGPLPWSRLYTRAIVHHELFHVVDFGMHRDAGVRFGLADAKWETLNTAGFKYDEAVKADLQSPALDPKLKGFLSRYAMATVAEDKAVLYSFMITQGQMVDGRAKADPVLQSKTDRMKEMLKEFCPQANEEFWKAARKVARYGS